MIVIQWLLSPLFFGVAFLGPLIAQLLLQLGWVTTGNSHWYLDLACGAALGLAATLRGSWIWIKP